MQNWLLNSQLMSRSISLRWFWWSVLTTRPVTSPSLRSTATTASPGRQSIRLLLKIWDWFSGLSMDLTEQGILWNWIKPKSQAFQVSPLTGLALRWNTRYLVLHPMWFPGPSVLRIMDIQILQDRVFFSSMRETMPLLPLSRSVELHLQLIMILRNWRFSMMLKLKFIRQRSLRSQAQQMGHNGRQNLASRQIQILKPI